MKRIVIIGLSSLLFIALVSISACSKSKTPATEDMNVPTTGTQNGHDWVDLGLSVKWATCNIGATDPEDYGDFYAWGEITPKSEFIWENYKFFIGEDSSENMAFSMYNTDVDYGTVDNKKRLAIADDAARVNWGGSWRMPMDTELQELMAECVWTWTEQAGVYGFKVTSKKNGNSIFFPQLAIVICWSTRLVGRMVAIGLLLSLLRLRMFQGIYASVLENSIRVMIVGIKDTQSVPSQINV